jgi:glyoxylase-like metal-dependent hydrolase (beta-lactamase superfamily II)
MTVVSSAPVVPGSPPTSQCPPRVTGFFDPATNTVSYVVADPATGACAVIDSVLDFDYAAGYTSTASADAIIAFIE